MKAQFMPVYGAGARMEALVKKLRAIDVPPTSENLALLQGIIIVQAQESGLSRDNFLAWAGRMYDSIAADFEAAKAEQKS